MTEMPRHNKFRPDFLAPGPHVTVQRNKPLSFDEPPKKPNTDDEEDSPPYKYYPSDKILGKLYCAIDECQVFQEVQQGNASQKLYPAGKSSSCSNSVLESVWNCVNKKCRLITWAHHLDLARAIRDEYAIPLALSSNSPDLLLTCSPVTNPQFFI